jgi:hypothetical protein
MCDALTEFNKWKEEMIARDISFPTIQAIQERRKAIKDALNFRVCCRFKGFSGRSVDALI